MSTTAAAAAPVADPTEGPVSWFAPDGSDRIATTALGIYVHVPFCIRRCGYCAFNTVAVGSSLERDVAREYLGGVLDEIAIADRVIGAQRPPLTSVYFGGGTPTMLAASDIGAVIAAVRDRFEVSDQLEVTVESNPDGLRVGQLPELREVGATRVSFGLQSVRAAVLAVLDRSHSPEAALSAVDTARRAGFDHVGLDLIHGTPGERPDDWAATLGAAINSGVDHISAYALSIEPGTKLAARVRRGELRRPSSDEAAERYRLADRMLAAAGFDWYELSNWARRPDARSAHNLLYWRNHHWWGIGPGAHSHMGGRRWWNTGSTSDWAAAVADRRVPADGSEVTDPGERALEQLMLGIRLAEGIPVVSVPAPDEVQRLVEDGLVRETGDTLALTLQGRLMADLVIRRCMR